MQFAYCGTFERFDSSNIKIHTIKASKFAKVVCHVRNHY